MDYTRYQAARDLSWEVLLGEGVAALPVSVSGLCRQMGIGVKYYVGDGTDGESRMVRGRPLILVSRSVPVPRQRFTAAHELGHVLLGHLGTVGLVNREPGPTDDPIEREANVFASRLLAPACVLWGCGVRAPEEIVELCNISLQAARFRWLRMEELYRRNRFLTSPLERAVFEQFRPFIEARRNAR